MSNNDKLITELRRARNELCEQCGNYRDAHMGACDGCHWKEEWRGGIEEAHDALALLKAQDPRVMTLEEVQASINPVWIEGGMNGGTWAMMPKTLEQSIEFVANGVYTLYPAFAIDEYNKTWRCWTSRPTKE